MSRGALEFAPHHALGGGVLLGLAVIGELALTGRVLGVSGAFKGLARGDRALVCSAQRSMSPRPRPAPAPASLSQLPCGVSNF